MDAQSELGFHRLFYICCRVHSSCFTLQFLHNVKLAAGWLLCLMYETNDGICIMI